jgi:hypothetical protein
VARTNFRKREPLIAVSGDAAAHSAALDHLCIDTIRTLAIDAVQKAKSGHPGTPMALAPVAYTLWQGALRYDCDHPKWRNRDRFVLSNGHASMLLYALLHLARVRDPEEGGRPASASTTSGSSANSAAAALATRNMVSRRAWRPRPARSVRAATTASAWRSADASWRAGSIGPVFRCSISMCMPSAAMAT